MRVTDKVFVVTGAGSGIGRELTLCLLSRGAHVAGVDLDPTSVQMTGELAPRHASRFVAFAADVSQRSAVETLPEQVLAHFGRVDGIINNAGIIQPFRRLNDLAYSTIERRWTTGLTANPGMGTDATTLETRNEIGFDYGCHGRHDLRFEGRRSHRDLEGLYGDTRWGYGSDPNLPAGSDSGRRGQDGSVRGPDRKCR